MEPLVSVVVPLLADEAHAQQLLSTLRPDPRVEVIYACAGDAPRLAAMAAGRDDVRIVRTGRGRGLQMNAGAAGARGAWLLFLHADSTLPPDWLAVFARSVGRASGGWFRFALDDRAWQARAIEWGVRWRVRLFRLPYGDQGLFVRRDTFEQLGGFRELPLMEDVDFVRRLVATTAVVELPVPLVTSARRWRQDGWVRRSVRNVVLVTLYFAGVRPARLARWYRAQSGG